MAATVIDASRLQTSGLLEKPQAPETPDAEQLRYFDVWDNSIWEDEERNLDRPSAVDDIVRRSAETTRDENSNDEKPATNKKRAADIETAIKWIRKELVRLQRAMANCVRLICVFSQSDMREQDRKLLRQFTAIRNSIQHLKTMQDISSVASISTLEGDWDSESWRSSMSSESSTPPHTPVSPFAQARLMTPTNNNWKTPPRVSQLAAGDTRKPSSSDPASPVQLRLPQTRYSRPKSVAQSAVALKPIHRVVVLRKPVNLSPNEDELRKNKRNSWC
jgi:hypothetical protein